MSFMLFCSLHFPCFAVFSLFFVQEVIALLRFLCFFFLVLLLGFNLNIQYMKKLSTIFKTLASSVFTTNHLAARTLRSLFGFLII